MESKLEKNKEFIKSKQEKGRATRLKESRKKYYEANKEKIKAWNRRYKKMKRLRNFFKEKLCLDEELEDDETWGESHHTFHLIEFEEKEIIFEVYSNLDDFQREFWVIDGRKIREADDDEDELFREADNNDPFFECKDCKIIISKDARGELTWD